MSAFAIALLPVVSKAIIKIYLGDVAANVAGTALTVALKSFSDREIGKAAARKSEAIASAIVTDLENWLVHEATEELPPEFWAAELVEVLEAGFSEKAVIQSALDHERLSSSLIGLKISDWRLSGETVEALMPKLTKEICRLLIVISPQMPNYGFERDKQTLATLEAVSENIDSLLRQQVSLSVLLSTLEARPREAWQSYETAYLNRIAAHLDYVEILGLDLKRVNRHRVPTPIGTVSR